MIEIEDNKHGKILILDKNIFEEKVTEEKVTEKERREASIISVIPFNKKNILYDDVTLVKNRYSSCYDDDIKKLILNYYNSKDNKKEKEN